MDYIKTIIPDGMYILANNYYSLTGSNPSTWNAWVGVGKGSDDWSNYETVTPLNTQLTLYNEIVRIEPTWAGYLNETLYDMGEIEASSTQTFILRYVAEFPSMTLNDIGLVGVYLREYALFMDGTQMKSTGDPCLIINHSRFWWNAGTRLRREIIMDLRGV